MIKTLAHIYSHIIWYDIYDMTGKYLPECYKKSYNLHKKEIIIIIKDGD